MKWLKWVKRWWPFVLRSDYDEVCRKCNQNAQTGLQYQRDRDKAIAERDEFNAQMVRMQARCPDHIRRMGEYAWQRATKDLIRLIDDQYSRACFVTPPKIDVYRIPGRAPSHSDFYRTENIGGVDLHFTCGLSSECEPELVARRIGEDMGRCVERTILEKWRHQSLLLRENT